MSFILQYLTALPPAWKLVYIIIHIFRGGRHFPNRPRIVKLSKYLLLILGGLQIIIVCDLVLLLLMRTPAMQSSTKSALIQYAVLAFIDVAFLIIAVVREYSALWRRKKNKGVDCVMHEPVRPKMMCMNTQ